MKLAPLVKFLLELHQNSLVLYWFVVLGAVLAMLLHQWLELHQNGLLLCLLVLIGAGLAICLHEFGHAIAAYWGGDKSVKAKGYLTLNPLKYTHISPSLVQPVVFLLLGGLALPGGAVYIDPHLLRGRVWQSAMSAAGPGMTALAALLLSLAFRFDFPIDSSGWFWPALAFLAQSQIAALLLNLLPIPALDGYGILEPWLPLVAQDYLQGLKRAGFLVVLAIFLGSPDFARWFWEVSLVITTFLGIPSDLATEGQVIFSAYRFSLLPLLMGLAVLYKQRHKPEANSKEEVLREQGAAFLKQGQYRKAQEHYQQALTDYPEDKNLRLDYGLALAFQGQFEAAVAEYDQVLTQLPEDHNALHFKADALLELKQYEAALAFFDRILVQSPHDSHFLHDRGFVLQQLGRDEDSIFCYEQATHHEPLDDIYWGALVAVQQKLGNLYASDKNLEAGLRRNSKSEYLWQMKLWRCLNEYRYGDFFEACERFEAETEGQSSLPLAYRAIGLGDIQQYSAAMATFEQALTCGSDEAWIRANRADCLIEMRCFEQALSELKTIGVTDANSHQPLCLKVKALGLIGMKRYEAAIAIYEQLLASETLDDENRSSILINRGYALSKQGNLQAALASHGQALVLQPDDAHALSHRGDVLIQLGQLQAGLADQDRAIELKPEQPQGWKAKGDSLQRLGQYRQAIDSYQQSLGIKPDIGILCGQAICFLGLHEPDSALQALQKAQELHEPTTRRTVAEKPELAAFFQANFEGSPSN